MIDDFISSGEIYLDAKLLVAPVMGWTIEDSMYMLRKYRSLTFTLVKQQLAKSIQVTVPYEIVRRVYELQ